MTFRTRNPYYLRISERIVLPLYVYLDERHVDWMSDRILQHVLADLRPKILPKLQAEVYTLEGSGGAASKKVTVDTHRGETYQFCYFLRKAGSHSVLVKTRNFVAVPPTKENVVPTPLGLRQPQKKKRKGNSDPTKSPSVQERKKRKTKGKARAQEAEDDVLIISSEEEDAPLTRGQRRSTRAKKSVPVDYHDGSSDDDVPVVLEPNAENSGVVDPAMDSEAQFPGSFDIDLEIEEEEKPKPKLQLKYQGYTIHGYCLCIVVEPWPAVRSASRANSALPITTLLTGVPARAAGANAREKTPLFLPEEPEPEMSEARSSTTGIQQSSLRIIDSMMVDDSDSDSSNGGAWRKGEFQSGGVDDEDLDGNIFLGDADEARGQ
ncbi:hypothetical protein BD779DRAFT_1782049 [Infundibulicybe gibba]|nr:hypothetical protein BD779DRAFT_1782049 [Infundibulicybe gibba]